MRSRPDRFFFFIVVLLAVAGFFIFSSASLDLLGRDGATFGHVAWKQFAVLIGGLVTFLIVSKINHQHWQRVSLGLLVASIVLTLLVFVPGVGFEAGGAKRWIAIGSLTVQPAEFLKLAFVLFIATWLAKRKQEIRSLRRGLLPFLTFIAVVAVIMIAQPDIDTLVIMVAAAGAMFFAAGARWSHIGLIILTGLVAIAILAVTKPYIMARIKTFISPSEHTLTSSYQINQSLIALGSGGLAGRGFGQSIQKFKYLPEPIGDSIFSVAGEEFGFIGTAAIVALFVAFALSGLKIASRATNPFGRLVSIGIVIMILTGAFINIASMLALIPLTGTPLLFISHGGTALLLALVAAGIVCNVSRRQVKTNYEV